MQYMLDTNILVYVLNARPQHQAVLDRFNQHDARQLCLSSITLAELRFGVAQSTQHDATQSKLDRIVATLNVAHSKTVRRAPTASCERNCKRPGRRSGRWTRSSRRTPRAWDSRSSPTTCASSAG